MAQLILALMTWASVFTGLPLSPPPVVLMVPQKELQAFAGHFSGTLAGAYKDGVIYLPESFDRESPVYRSTLIHELVHHLQERSGKRYLCRQAAEKVAYEAQQEYLRQHGVDFWQVHGIDKLMFFFFTTCTPGHWQRSK